MLQVIRNSAVVRHLQTERCGWGMVALGCAVALVASRIVGVAIIALGLLVVTQVHSARRRALLAHLRAAVDNERRDCLNATPFVVHNEVGDLVHWELLLKNGTKVMLKQVAGKLFDPQAKVGAFYDELNRPAVAEPKENALKQRMMEWLQTPACSAISDAPKTRLLPVVALPGCGTDHNAAITTACKAVREYLETNPEGVGQVNVIFALRSEQGHTFTLTSEQLHRIIFRAS